MTRRPLAFFMAVVMATSPGCALFMRGPNQNVDITWSPPQAKVTLDNQPLQQQGTIELTRGDNHIVIVDAEGFDRKLVTIKSEASLAWQVPEVLLAALLCVSILALPLGIPLLIDGMSGSVCDLRPPVVDVKLEPTKAPPPERKDWPPPEAKPPAETPKPKKLCKVCGAERGDGPVCNMCGAR
jgi:hypothetical protein